MMDLLKDCALAFVLGMLGGFTWSVVERFIRWRNNQ